MTDCLLCIGTSWPSISWWYGQWMGSEPRRWMTQLSLKTSRTLSSLFSSSLSWPLWWGWPLSSTSASGSPSTRCQQSQTSARSQKSQLLSHTRTQTEAEVYFLSQWLDRIFHNQHFNLWLIHDSWPSSIFHEIYSTMTFLWFNISFSKPY